MESYNVPKGAITLFVDLCFSFCKNNNIILKMDAKASKLRPAVTKLLNAGLAYKGWGVADLSRALESKYGITIDRKNLSQKKNTGVMPASLLLACIVALDIKSDDCTRVLTEPGKAESG